MEKLIEFISSFFDHLYFSFIDPIFFYLGRVLEYLLISPLDFFHVPPIGKIILVALLTAALSLVLRRLLKVDEKERAFKKLFMEKKEKQQDLTLIPDWKSREALYRVTDNDIDEDFNTYIAGRYASYVAIYLLPIFLTIHWLGTIFNEAPFVMYLPAENPCGLEGLSIQLVFLATYVIGLVTFYFMRKKMRKNTSFNT